jgi:hypothetical protein
MEGQYEHHDPEGTQGEEYRNEGDHATAAAIAAMVGLADQHSLPFQDQGSSQSMKSGGRSKKDTGPDAERARKDNHKEVERKRREQISNGITELAAIVPGCDAKGVNKTAVINAAVRYIQELKNNEASNIEKWTLEKLLMDQAMNDLHQQNARLRARFGVEGEAEDMTYHNEMDDEKKFEEAHNGSETSANLDPNLETAAREGAAASALSEVAAAAAAAAAAADTATAEAEKLLERKTDAAATAPRSRSRGHAEVEAKEEPTGRSKRTRH